MYTSDAPVALVALPLVHGLEQIDEFSLAQSRGHARGEQREDESEDSEKAVRRHECGSNGWLARFTTENTEIGKEEGVRTRQEPTLSSFWSGSVASVLSVVKKHFYPK